VPSRDWLGTTRSGGVRTPHVRLDRSQAAFVGLQRPEWTERAACGGVRDWRLLDTIFFSERGSTERSAHSTHREQQARRICAGCEVRRQCLIAACTEETSEPEGTRGGCHARERRAVRWLPVEERIRQLDTLFKQRVKEVLLVGEVPAA
jgi:transcription factor WhiB